MMSTAKHTKHTKHTKMRAIPIVRAAILSILTAGAIRVVAQQKGAELTLRNLTQETVNYSIALDTPDAKPEERHLAPNAIDRFGGDAGRIINFESLGKPVSYGL